MESRNFTFGKTKDTEIKKNTINTLNAGKVPLEIVFEEIPSYLKLTAEPFILKPQEKGKITLEFNASQNGKYGDIRTDIQITVVTKTTENKGSIPVIAVIEEDFSHLSEKELANAPIIKFKEKQIDIGLIKKGEKINCEFKFSNEGKRDLIIRNIQLGREYTILKFDEVLKSGESGIIEIILQTYSNSERYKKSITIISNDPKNTTSFLTITGKGKKEQPDHKPGTFEHIPSEKALALIEEFYKDDKLVILDVRTAEEFCENHLKNSINLDFHSNDFKKILSILDKDKIYLVYCKIGKRSAETLDLMQDLGFRHAYNMKDGIIGWKKSGYPLKK